MFGIGPLQLLIVGVVALLLFGNRLPEVARSLGKSMTEFKRGMQGVQDEFNDAARVDYSSEYDRGVDDGHTGDGHTDDVREPATPKFVPPTSPPRDE